MGGTGGARAGGRGVRHPARGARRIVFAGIAVALQRVITAFAAYFVILRGRIFIVGDRIVMGGVRGDVVSIGFIEPVYNYTRDFPFVDSAELAPLRIDTGDRATAAAFHNGGGTS